DREGVVLPGRRELAAGWQLLEDRHGLRPRDCRLLRAPGAPENLRQPAQRVALTETVADSAMTLARFLDRLDGGVALIRHVALARAALEQVCPLLGRQGVAETKRAPVLRRGFAVSSHGGGALCRGRGELEHGSGVSGRLGVMRQPREIQVAAGRDTQ